MQLCVSLLNIEIWNELFIFELYNIIRVVGFFSNKFVNLFYAALAILHICCNNLFYEKTKTGATSVKMN
jgi:hypothetical protein